MKVIRRRPRWLCAPTRAASLPSAIARALLAGSGLLLFASAWNAATAANLTDALSIALADGVRHGGAFYDVARDTMRGGADPGSIVPLPALALLTGAVPLRLAIVALGLLCMAVLALWHQRLGPAFRGAGAFTLALVLVTAGLPILLGPDAVNVPEAWAGLLVATALARWSATHPFEGCCWAVAASAISLFALAMPIVMLGGAAGRRRRPEALAWAAALAIEGVLWLLHRHTLASFAPPPQMPTGDDAGLGISTGAFAACSFLGLLPPALAGPLLVLAMAGWAGWQDPLGPRVATLTAAMFLLVAIAGRVQIVLLVAPLWLAGLAFAPDALRDLLRRALDRQRPSMTEVAP